jgi:hypothetical protein
MPSITTVSSGSATPSGTRIMWYASVKAICSRLGSKAAGALAARKFSAVTRAQI